ncbi:hypothetical protein ACRQ5Q_11470 [Bradyrhizobium sp. PMVTL-01]|uniref:hypothetical protein n=1 Tax=Bradyrhizobium sp. PMVTL-01 TaxID=3434999 RepID=UPI003F6EAB9F
MLAELIIARPQGDARFEQELKLQWAHRTALYAGEVERAHRLAGFLPATPPQIEQLQTIARNPELSSKFRARRQDLFREGLPQRPEIDANRAATKMSQHVVEMNHLAEAASSIP